MADHDQRMKTAVREFAAEFQDLVVPAWTGRFDLTAPEWQQQEVYLDPPRGERRHIDLVALVSVTQPVEESNQALLHVEVESADSLTDLRGRMPRYRHALAYRHNLPVLSLALYMNVGLEGRGWDEAVAHFWEQKVDGTSWAYLGLPALDALTYVEGANILGVALSVLMRCPEDRKVWLKARAMQRIAEAELTVARRYLLMEIVEAYLPLVGPHLAEYERLLLTEDFKMARVLGQTSFEKGIEKGKEIARAEFDKEIAQANVEKGHRLLLQRQLEKRFGSLSPAARARLESWGAERLLQLGEDLLSDKSLVDLGLEDAPNGTAPPPG